MTMPKEFASPRCHILWQKTSLILSTITALVFLVTSLAQPAAAQHSGHKIGLGTVLSSAYGGQIFGFDVDQNGTDGINDDAVTMPDGSLKSAIETFDLKTGKITKVVKTIESATGDNQLVTFGIFGTDVGLVDEERVHIGNGHVTRNDLFYLLDPVSGETITGQWTPPHQKGLLLFGVAPNQATSTQVALVYRLSGTNDVPWLYVTDLATNTIVNTFPLTKFEDDFLLPLGQDSSTNEAVTAISSAPGGPPPVSVVINLATGKMRTFNGFNNGFYGAGGINGVAVDSTTDMMCTTTELNSQVEFYKISNGKGTWAQLPNTDNTDEIHSATAITNDPLHHLFLVAQPTSSTGGNSTIYVYDEKANLKETINGFTLNVDLPPSFGIKIAINPSLRIGWVQGANANQLQQFFY